MSQGSTPPGWYPAPGDPPGTHRYWDGNAWTTGPQQMQASPAPGAGAPTGMGVPMGGAGPHGYAPAAGGPARPLASPGQRIVARLIDYVPFGIVQSIAYQSSTALFVLVALAAAAYEIYFTATKSATLGKQAMGIAIEMQGTGQLMTGYGPAALRWVIGFIPCSFIISLVLLFTDSKHETLNDKLGKTWVVKVK